MSPNDGGSACCALVIIIISVVLTLAWMSKLMLNKSKFVQIHKYLSRTLMCKVSSVTRKNRQMCIKVAQK